MSINITTIFISVFGQLYNDISRIKTFCKLCNIVFIGSRHHRTRIVSITIMPATKTIALMRYCRKQYSIKIWHSVTTKHIAMRILFPWIFFKLKIINGRSLKFTTTTTIIFPENPYKILRS